MFKIRNFIPAVGLVLILLVLVFSARTASASISANDPASTLRNPIKAPVSSYRTPQDECFDVPMSELANCRSAIPAPTGSLARLTLPQTGAGSAKTLVETVRQATEPFKNLEKAQAAGYGLFHGCVSGPQNGAMGVHFVNGDLVGDGVLDPMQPEALLYEYKDGQARLVGVEYVVIAEAWDANNEAPPVLMGQLFNYGGGPNRYGIPAFYELHVWAWEQNPNGTFADWNPKVTCDEYNAGDTAHTAGQ